MENLLSQWFPEEYVKDPMSLLLKVAKKFHEKHGRPLVLVLDDVHFLAKQNPPHFADTVSALIDASHTEGYLITLLMGSEDVRLVLPSKRPRCPAATTASSTFLPALAPPLRFWTRWRARAGRKRPSS